MALVSRDPIHNGIVTHWQGRGANEAQLAAHRQTQYGQKRLTWKQQQAARLSLLLVSDPLFLHPGANKKALSVQWAARGIHIHRTDEDLDGGAGGTMSNTERGEE